MKVGLTLTTKEVLEKEGLVPMKLRSTIQEYSKSLEVQKLCDVTSSSIKFEAKGCVV